MSPEYPLVVSPVRFVVSPDYPFVVSSSNHEQALRPFNELRAQGGTECALDREALPAAALALDVGVAEAERLVEALLDEIDLGPVDVAQAFAVDDDLHPAVLEHDVIRTDVVGVIDHVSVSGAARLLDAQSKSKPMSTAGQERLHTVGGGGSQCNAHVSFEQIPEIEQEWRPVVVSSSAETGSHRNETT